MGLSKQKKGMVVVVLLGCIVAVLNQSMLSPALPSIMADTGVSATTAQWLASVYSLVEAIVIPLSAYLLGRFSTRRLFVGALSIFTVGSLVAALEPTFPVILVGRILQATGTGVLVPMTYTLIMLIFPIEQRGTAMGLVMLCAGFAPAVGPTVAGLLVDGLGWHAIFAIMAVVAACVAVAGARVMQDMGDFERTRLDVSSVALCSLGLLCLLYGLSSFTSASMVAIPVTLILAGLVLMVVFVRRQLQMDQPMLKVSVLKSRRFRTEVIAIMIMQAVLAGITVIVPLYLQNALGYSATVSGLVMMPGAIGGALGGLLAGRLFDKVGVRPLAVAGSLIMLAGGICMCTFGWDTAPWFVAVAYALAFMSMQFIMSPLQTWGVNSLDNRLISHANALSNTMNQVSASFGTALIVSLMALAPVFYPSLGESELTLASYHVGFVVATVLIVVVLAIVVVFARDRTDDRGLTLEETQSR